MWNGVTPSKMGEVARGEMGNVEDGMSGDCAIAWNRGLELEMGTGGWDLLKRVYAYQKRQTGKGHQCWPKWEN